MAVMAFHSSRMGSFNSGARSPGSQLRIKGVKCHPDAAPNDESFSFHQKTQMIKSLTFNQKPPFGQSDKFPPTGGECVCECGSRGS